MTKQQRRTHLDTTSGGFLEQHFGNEPRFGGVLANDELKRPKKDTGYILNLENQDEPGSHWVALYNGHYYDSFGVPPTKKIAPFVKDWNHDEYQGLNQESCGYYAVYALKNLFAGRPPYADMIPGQQQHNERILKKFFY